MSLIVSAADILAQIGDDEDAQPEQELTFARKWIKNSMGKTLRVKSRVLPRGGNN